MTIYDQMLNENKFLFAKVSTISLHALDKNGIINGTGSASIIKYKGRKILLTVSHNILDDDKYLKNPMGIQIGITQDFKSMEYYIPTFEWLGQISINEEILKSQINFIEYIEDKYKVIDFSYSLLPDSIQPRDEYINYEKQEVHFFDKNIIETELNINPSLDENYFFYGHTRTELRHEIKKFSYSERYVEKIKYINTMPDKVFHIFHLPEIIKDEYDYKGCSGTPIFNENGEIVSLLAKGLKGTKAILGVNLQKYKLGIDISLM